MLGFTVMLFDACRVANKVANFTLAVIYECIAVLV